MWLTGTEYSYLDYANAADLQSQTFYHVLEAAAVPFQFIVKPLLTYYYLGGVAAVTWTLAFPQVFGLHSTFLVNSASHAWGSRPYKTGESTVELVLCAAAAAGVGRAVRAADWR
jgi:fatty-acid desaturase